MIDNRSSSVGSVNRPKKVEPVKKSDQRIKTILAIVSLLVLLGTGLVRSNLDRLENSIAKTKISLGEGDDNATDILLVGTDSRTDAHGNRLSTAELKDLRAGEAISTNTDTIILIRIPNNDRSATAISIPRDSYITLENGEKTKINSIYGSSKEAARIKAVKAGTPDDKAEEIGAEEGRKSLTKAVENFTGITIDHYAEIGLLGFILLTNAVDGVEVCLKNPVNEPLSGAKFPAGKQTLDGKNALSFVRQRHGLPRGDLDRIGRQQAFMAAISDKILSARVLSNPSTLGKLENAVRRSVVIDDNWNILDFAQNLSDLAGGDVRFVTIPIIKENGWSDDGMQSVVQVDPNKVKKFVAATAREKEKKTDPKSIDWDKNYYTINIYNSTPTPGLAGEVATSLKRRKIKLGEVDNYNGFPQDKSLIRAKNADLAVVKYFQALIPAAQVEVDTELAENTIEVVIGKEYRGPKTEDTSNSLNLQQPKTITAADQAVNCIN